MAAIAIQIEFSSGEVNVSSALHKCWCLRIEKWESNADQRFVKSWKSL
jgi:hypothetical protein